MDVLLTLVAIACAVALFAAPWVVMRWLSGPSSDDRATDDDGAPDDRDPRSVAVVHRHLG